MKNEDIIITNLNTINIVNSKLKKIKLIIKIIKIKNVNDLINAKKDFRDFPNANNIIIDRNRPIWRKILLYIIVKIK